MALYLKYVNVYTKITIGLMIILISLSSCASKGVQSLEDVEQPVFKGANTLDDEDILGYIEKTMTIIVPLGIYRPLNTITLIKTKNEYCAIKFTILKRGNDSKKATTFDSGSKSFFVEYDLYQVKKKHDTSKKLKKVRTEHYKLNSKSAIGIGRLSFARGDTNISCGSVRPLWKFPTGIHFSEHDKTTKYAISLSQDFESIDFEDDSLVWYGVDNTREMFIVK